MSNVPTRALSDVLEQLEQSVEGDSIQIRAIVERLGHASFGALILTFSLISTSPASAIPGVTAAVAVIVFLLVAQIIIGRTSVWLPEFILRRQLAKDKLCKGIAWLRKPVRFVERFLRPRLTFILHRPQFYLPLILILGLTLFMPLMEVIPGSGSIASATIALFAAGLLTRDGALVMIAMLMWIVVAALVWHFGFGR